MPLVAEIYIICAVLGMLALVITAFMGGLGHAHAAHGHIGHSSVGHTAIGHGAAQGAGGHTAIGHAAGGHGAGHLQVHPAHPVGGHSSSAQGGQHAPGHATAGHQAASQGAHHTSAHTGSDTTSGHRAVSMNEQSVAPTAATRASVLPSAPAQSPVVSLLLLCNPTVFSTFVLWFGASGLFAWRLLQFLPLNATLPIAALGGVLGTKVTLNLLGALTSGMHSSASFSQESLIGLPAEVTVSLQDGGIGEITCIAGGPRYNFSARALHKGSSFRRQQTVIISDIQDGVAFIEEYPDGSEVRPPSTQQPDAVGSAIAIEPEKDKA